MEQQLQILFVTPEVVEVDIVTAALERLLDMDMRLAHDLYHSHGVATAYPPGHGAGFFLSTIGEAVS
jgi:hypothetical protein